MKRDNIVTNDRQLACARISSPEGQDYLKGMAAAANFAWVNRASMTFLCRQVIIHCFVIICNTFIKYFCLYFARHLQSNSIRHRTTLTCMLYTMSRTILPKWSNTQLAEN